MSLFVSFSAGRLTECTRCWRSCSHPTIPTSDYVIYSRHSNPTAKNHRTFSVLPHRSAVLISVRARCRALPLCAARNDWLARGILTTLSTLIPLSTSPRLLARSPLCPNHAVSSYTLKLVLLLSVQSPGCSTREKSWRLEFQSTDRDAATFAR